MLASLVSIKPIGWKGENMILQYCPETYKGKKYGCGFGPIDPTRAFLDLGGRCPKCKMPFRPYRKPKPVKTSTATQCQVSDVVTNSLYCKENAINGAYCQRHEYLNFR